MRCRDVGGSDFCERVANTVQVYGMPSKATFAAVSFPRCYIKAIRPQRSMTASHIPIQRSPRRHHHRHATKPGDIPASRCRNNAPNGVMGGFIVFSPIPFYNECKNEDRGLNDDQRFRRNILANKKC